MILQMIIDVTSKKCVRMPLDQIVGENARMSLEISPKNKTPRARVLFQVFPKIM
jgi:hypothetical protein